MQGFGIGCIGEQKTLLEVAHLHAFAHKKFVIQISRLRRKTNPHGSKLPKQTAVRLVKEAKPPKAPKAPKAAKEPKVAKAAKANKPSRAETSAKKAENLEAAKKATKKSAKT